MWCSRSDFQSNLVASNLSQAVHMTCGYADLFGRRLGEGCAVHENIGVFLPDQYLLVRISSPQGVTGTGRSGSIPLYGSNVLQTGVPPFNGVHPVLLEDANQPLVQPQHLLRLCQILRATADE